MTGEPTRRNAGRRAIHDASPHPGVSNRNATGPRTAIRTLKVDFTDPVCGKPCAAYEWKADRYGVERWLIGCANDPCRPPRMAPGDWLREVAGHAGTTAAELLRQPSEWLWPYELAEDPGPPPPLFLPEQARRWARAVRSQPAAWEYLVGVRQLSRAVLWDARVGWAPKWDRVRGDWCGPEALILPFCREGVVVAFKTCAVGGKLMNPLGSGVWEWSLYPEPQREFGWTWLVEGEWDALRLRSLGIPATSVPGGKGTWRDEWAEQLCGLRVLVMFDIGAEPYARRAVRRLRAAGIKATHSPAWRLGLTERNADVSDYLNAGGDPQRLRRPGVS